MSAPDGYEADKWAELRAVSERMRQIPEVVAAITERRALVLTCPRGHKITTVELEDTGDTITARPIARAGRKGGAAAVKGSPFRRGKSRCEEPGCPRLVDGEGWCEEHGGRQAITINELATRFTCPSVTAHSGKEWTDRVTTPRLLKVLTAAVVSGATRVPVSGHVGVSRRR